MLKVANSVISASQIATPITFAGDVTLSTGNLVIGTSGKGIDFSITSHPAGMTSELLADYEEGTWTPIDSSGAGLTFTGASGQYVKTGNIVQCAFAFTFPSTASTANVSIGGLPFTSGASDTGWGGYQTYTDYVVAQLAFLNNVSATTFTMWRNGSTIVNNVTLTGKTVRGVIIYRAA